MTAQTHPSVDVSSALMLLALGAVWGGSFFFAEVALNEVPPLTITLHRVAWAVPILAVVLWMKGVAIPHAPRIWGAYLVMGALNNAIPFALIFWAQTQLDSALAAILNATTATFAAVIAGLLLADEPLTGNRIGGALLGLAGVAIIMGPAALLNFDPGNLAQLAILAAAVSYSLAGVWGRTRLADQPPLMNAFGMLLCSTLLMIPAVLLVDGVPSLDLSLVTWGALAGLAGLSTALAYMLYFAILARAGAANLLLVTLLVPPFAIALGVLVLGERLPASAWAGMAVIFLGLSLTDGRLLRRPGQHRREGQG